MINKIQLISIKILNSNYKILFSLALYFLIFSVFYIDANITFCMMKKGPIISESKSIEELRRELHLLNKESLEAAKLSNDNFLLIKEEIKNWRSILPKRAQDDLDYIAKNGSSLFDEIVDALSLPVGIVEAEALPLAEVETAIRDAKAVKDLESENRNLQFQLENALTENELGRRHIKMLEEKLQREIENRNDLATNMFIEEKKQLLRRVQIAEMKPICEDKSTQAFSEQAIADAMLKSQPKRLRYLK